MPVHYLPKDCHNVIPYLLVSDAGKLLDFIKHTFDGIEIERMQTPDGSIPHAEIKIGDSIIMMGEARGDFKPLPSSLYVYVQNIDETYKRALNAGATSVMEPADQFYGDRSAGVSDPWGNFWWLGTHIEDVSQEEIARRAAEQYK
jgi:uncharacterized glyoxalase superfamily protein PhnB